MFTEEDASSQFRTPWYGGVEVCVAPVNVVAKNVKLNRQQNILSANRPPSYCLNNMYVLA